MKHIKVTAAILKFNDLILCMQRGLGKHHYTSNKFEFPGGKIEQGESPSEALKRELEEEMNITVNVGEEDHFLTVKHEYPDFEITLHSYLCKVDSQDFQMNEHVSFNWLPISELMTLDWAEADTPIVKKLIAEDN